MKASGTFEVDLQPLDPFTKGSAGIKLSRLSITKTFQGDLTANSLGEMFTVMTNTQGSAGYVAVEQVDGTLSGMQGTFVLQHFGVMQTGAERLILEVVPDSGTGQLEGISGSMAIVIENGSHLYDFEYSFA